MFAQKHFTKFHNSGVRVIKTQVSLLPTRSSTQSSTESQSTLLKHVRSTNLCVLICTNY